MAKIDFSQIPDDERIDIYRQASSLSRMLPYAVEKDWWVVETLDMIFGMPIAPKLVFKGGTSKMSPFDFVRFHAKSIFNHSFMDLKQLEILKKHLKQGEVYRRACSNW